MKRFLAHDTGKERSVIAPLLGRIYLWGGVLTAVCFCITLIWGFDVRQLFGFGIGYGFMCLQFWYFGYCCENAVTMDRKGAVRSMRVCYAVRMAAMVILSCGAAYTGFVNFTGILIPQLFPKIILTADHFIGRKG
ncbi:MAG: ATP synthase subunit I [Ruminococcus sp.]|nr:ATP synthase subunit I [Ruminococcus sp.]